MVTLKSKHTEHSYRQEETNTYNKNKLLNPL